MKNYKAAFFDIDGTLTSDRTWKGIMDYFQKNKLQRGTMIFYMASHYPLYFLRRLGLISESVFRAPWSANMAWFFRGVSIEEAQVVWDYTVEEHLNNCWRRDTRAILEHHSHAGDLVMLVSSGPQPLVERIATELGVEHAIGTRFETFDGRYTGRSLKPFCIGSYKAILPLQYMREHELEVDLEASFAYGDSVSDLPLLELVGNPVAVYPDQNLQAIAQARGWQVFPSSST